MVHVGVRVWISVYERERQTHTHTRTNTNTQTEKLLSLIHAHSAHKSGKRELVDKSRVCGMTAAADATQKWAALASEVRM